MTQPETRWPRVELDWDSEVRVIDPVPDHPTFVEEYIPPPPFIQEPPEPVPPRLRHRQSWDERHSQDVDDIRTALDMAKSNLHYSRDGCKAVQYHVEVAEQVDAAIDRVTEALRLIDIYDPE